MNYIAECLERFRQLPEETKNIFGGFEVLGIIKKLEEEYGVQLSFLVVLVLIGELEIKDIPEYLIKKFKLAEEDAFEIKSKLSQEIFSRLLAATNKFLDSEETIKEIMGEKLLDLLKEEKSILDFNEAVLVFLSTNGDLQVELEKLLLNNNEKLTSNSLAFEDREITPTIANWLKDFIKLNGSEMFDDLALAQYLSTAPNAKKLGLMEKDLLRKIIKLYRNLSFFPDSMVNYAIADWQIVPVDKIETKEFNDALDEGEQKKVEPPMKTEKIEVATKAKIEEKGEKVEVSPLDELNQVLSQYTPNSLEYKAVQEEIRRLKKKKK